jgi:hypothetical protein
MLAMFLHLPLSMLLFARDIDVDAISNHLALIRDQNDHITK